MRPVSFHLVLTQSMTTGYHISILRFWPFTISVVRIWASGMLFEWYVWHKGGRLHRIGLLVMLHFGAFASIFWIIMPVLSVYMWVEKRHTHTFEDM